MVEVADRRRAGSVWVGETPARQELSIATAPLPAPRPTAAGTVVQIRAALRKFAGHAERCLSEEIRHGHLFLFLPVGLGAGAAIWFSVPNPPAEMVLAGLLGILSVVIFRSTRGTAVNAVLWGTGLFLTGMLLADWETRRLSTVILDQPVVTKVSGIVERREQGAAGEWRYTLRVTGTAEPTLRRQPKRVSLLARSRHLPAAIGERLQGRARLSPPSGPALPWLNDFAFQSYFSRSALSVSSSGHRTFCQPARATVPVLWRASMLPCFPCGIGSRIASERSCRGIRVPSQPRSSRGSVAPCRRKRRMP